MNHNRDEIIKLALKILTAVTNKVELGFWCQNSYTKINSGDATSLASPDAQKYCLVGLLDRQFAKYGATPAFGIIFSSLRKGVEENYGFAVPSSLTDSQVVTRFNDNQHTLRRDILHLLDITKGIIIKEYA